MSTIHQETEAVATRAWTEGRIIYLDRIRVTCSGSRNA